MALSAYEQLSPASMERIDTFVDWFIRQDCVRPEINDLYLSDPDRADRMQAAADNGADGSTHQEIIDDWRKAFSHYVRNRKGYHNPPGRFIAAVEAYFDKTEQWHELNGSLDQALG